ncbi:lipoate--protein ligase [Gaoshiqia sediminis]|uniref:lipoate--protein ligase n=1 Tax=Gaoshiqia sediminis TaxID=2986998 RepID=A0AA42C948_9BACT|nr:lipoate--protein ligase [Gaoshiqia sediminis]MCW0483481.1 lipoate--protein ligase [Gaoshiqia sediminis]
MTVLCLHPTDLDPYFNLATEEYLLKRFTDDIFMLWRSESSIVVGKHQNALAEINHRYVRDHHIKVARRLSGGGTVFHDPGNLNFTFIKNVDRLEDVNFKVFTQPIVEVLQKLGLDAYSTGRNDLLIGGKKISGNAEHVFKKRVLHHGTLLFNSQLEKLRNALKVDLSRFEDKAVQSNRSDVTNIAACLPHPMSVDEFARFIFEEVAQSFPKRQFLNFSDDDRQAIRQLRNEKYSQWDWIYGYSPKYKYRNELATANGSLVFSLHVEKGKIKESHWEGAISANLSRKLSEKLVGINHAEEVLQPVIYELKTDLETEHIFADRLLERLV